jgi:hypothetical protein
MPNEDQLKAVASYFGVTSDALFDSVAPTSLGECGACRREFRDCDCAFDPAGEGLLDALHEANDAQEGDGDED